MSPELGLLVESLARLTGACCTGCERGGPCEGKVRPIRRAKALVARVPLARKAKIHHSHLPR